ncbi:MAG: DUF285 domain-containing protein [Lachnospiraceae bacterium]|nr:DUF285 domain-containing protein [Lachnospiraceae bacterium]
MRKFRKTSARIIGVLLCVAMCLETNGFTALAAEVNTTTGEEAFEVVDETTVEETEAPVIEEESVFEEQEETVEEEPVSEEQEETVEEEPVSEELEETIEEEPVSEEQEETIEEEPVFEEQEETLGEDPVIEDTPVFNLENGVLTVNADADWLRTDDSLPLWYENRAEIVTANVKLANVTDVSYMFADCVNLTEVNFEDVDTSAVTDFSYMFKNCKSLETVNLTGITTKAGKKFIGMFEDCTSLKELDLSMFVISADADTKDFFNCTNEEKSVTPHKIETPSKCGAEILLPRKYATSKGKKYEKFPKEKTSLLFVFNVSYKEEEYEFKNPNPTEIVYGKKITLKNPTRTGYKFEKWIDTIGSTVTELNGEHDYSLKAVWTPIKYTLVLKGNGGTRIADDGTGNTTNTVTIENIPYDVSLNDLVDFSALGDESTIFTKKGYSLLSWTTKANGKGKSYYLYELGESSGLSAKDGGQITLYVKWEAIRYNLCMHRAADTVDIVTVDDSNMTSDWGDIEWGLADAYYNKKTKLPKNKFENPGYYFVGWSRTKGGEVEYKDMATIKNLADTENAYVDFYAVWAPVTYTVKFNLNGSKGKVPATVKDCQIGVKSVDLPALRGDASYSLNTKLDENGNKLYTFVGWSMNKNISYFDDGYKGCYGEDHFQNANIAATKKNQVVTLYAMWQYEYKQEINEDIVNTYKSFYNANVNMGSQDGFQVLNDWNDYNTGYYCIGYNTSKANAQKGKVNVKFNKNYKNFAGKTLYAVWKPINYKVKFDKNAPNGVKVTGSMKTMSCKGNKAYETPTNNFKAPGYKFGGWIVINLRNGDTVGNVPDETTFSLNQFTSSKHNKDVFLFEANWVKIE